MVFKKPFVIKKMEIPENPSQTALRSNRYQQLREQDDETELDFIVTDTDNVPGAATWYLIILYFLTDVWLLVLSILTVVEITKTDGPYINPLAWSISVPIVSFLFGLLWLYVKYKALVSKPISAFYKKDFTMTSYVDYITWFRAAAFSFMASCIFTSASAISYSIRFDSSEPRDRASILTNLSASVWIFNTMALPAFLCVFSLCIQSIATWKYWALIWSCTNLAVFKNPYGLLHTVYFNHVPYMPPFLQKNKNSKKK